MLFNKIRHIFLAAVIGIATICALLGILGAAPVLAQEPELTGPMYHAPRMQMEPRIIYVVYFTDPVTLPIQDLSGNVIGEGTHQGQALCIDVHCDEETEIIVTSAHTDSTRIEYNYASVRSIDLEEGRVVIEGFGTLNRHDQTVTFSVTVTIVDLGDGTLYTRYDASLPEASLIIPSTPGSIEFLMSSSS